MAGETFNQNCKNDLQSLCVTGSQSVIFQVGKEVGHQLTPGRTIVFFFFISTAEIVLTDGL